VGVEVRAALSDGDLAAWVAVKNAVVPGEPSDVDELRREAEHDRESGWLLALADGVAGGCGVVRRSNASGLAFAMVRVLPAQRRRGIGSALYAALSGHARGLGLDAIRTRAVEDDDGTLRFLARRGFVEVGREYEVRLGLRAGEAATATPAPDGVDLVSLGSRLDLVPQVHALAVETVGETAGAEEVRIPSLEVWRVENVDGALLDGSLLAVAGGRVVGSAGLAGRPAEPDVAEHLLTAVTGSWRRRGVAMALKSAQIDWARGAGYRELVAFNNGANEPMRRLNARLGYAPRPAWITFHGPLAP
jgi:mycothiol synthase